MILCLILTLSKILVPPFGTRIAYFSAASFLKKTKRHANLCCALPFLFSFLCFQFVPSGCNNASCAGSIMMCPPPVKSRDQPRPRDEVLAQAKDFIDQYYASIKRYRILFSLTLQINEEIKNKSLCHFRAISACHRKVQFNGFGSHVFVLRSNTTAHQQRWTEVEAAIEKKGTYELTSSELTFGAKTGWRNAARCIGRIQWSKLQARTFPFALFQKWLTPKKAIYTTASAVRFM